MSVGKGHVPIVEVFIVFQKAIMVKVFHFAELVVVAGPPQRDKTELASYPINFKLLYMDVSCEWMRLLWMSNIFKIRIVAMPIVIAVIIHEPVRISTMSEIVTIQK